MCRSGYVMFHIITSSIIVYLYYCMHNMMCSECIHATTFMEINYSMVVGQFEIFTAFITNNIMYLIVICMHYVFVVACFCQRSSSICMYLLWQFCIIRCNLVIFVFHFLVKKIGAIWTNF